MTSVERVPSEEELNEIQARAAAATPGPWECGRKYSDAHVVFEASAMVDSIGIARPLGDGRVFTAQIASIPRESFTSDAVFIAASRSDVPRLVEAVRVLQGQVQRALAKGREDSWNGEPIMQTCLRCAVLKAARPAAQTEEIF